jgi:hypothetical protein
VSDHSPEKGASAGWDHRPWILCDSTIADQFAVLLVKKIVLPSGENAGEPSFAGPETTPGAKTCGVGADEVDHPTSGADQPMPGAVKSDAKTRARMWWRSNGTAILQERF